MEEHCLQATALFSTFWVRRLASSLVALTQFIVQLTLTRSLARRYSDNSWAENNVLSSMPAGFSSVSGKVSY